MRVFLIDAHPIVREAVRRRLDDERGFDVVGEAADFNVAVLAQEPCDLVVTDQLPCRAADKASSPAVIVLSHRAHPLVVAQALRAGARAYVFKQSPPDRIVNALKAVVAGGTFVDGDMACQLNDATEATPLSRRESEVLNHIAAGSSSKSIARDLGISVRTVESHRLSLRRKLSIDSHAGLIKYALQQRLGIEAF